MLTTLQAAAIIAPMLGLVAAALLWGRDWPTETEDMERLARSTGVLRDREAP